MYTLQPGEESSLAPFFIDVSDTTIYSYLQGHFGQGWADRPATPRCGRIIVGDFCFFGGDAAAEGADELLRDFSAREKNWILAVPSTPAWGEQIERAYPGKFKKFSRYAIKKQPERFDTAYLQSCIDRLAPEFTLARFDREICDQALNEEFSRDFCSNFLSIEDFLDRGMGFGVLHNGKLVAGASSYTIYDQGVEIEIATHPDYRQKGLATVCGARIMLECLQQGLYPNWDAANLNSVGLAKKLGYQLDHAYDTYRLAW